jgi:MFS family permease
MIALLLAGGGMYNYYKLSLLMPSIIADFEFSYGVAGLLAGFFGLIQLLLSIPLGMLVRGPSLRKVTAYALVVLILGSLLVCVVSDPYVLFVARLIEGAGAALALVAAPFLIYEVFAKQRVWLGLGVLMLFNPVGNILGLNVTSWFLKMFGWRGAWLTGVILPALALALLLVTKPVEIRIMSRSSITVKSGLRERLLIDLLQLGCSLTAMGFLIVGPNLYDRGLQLRCK